MEFGYNEPTSPGPTITNVNCAESLKHNVHITMNFRSLTPSKRAAVIQENNDEGENTQ
jgi:hypothetical protein